jgi:Skp family chaperone for outer membrane proteins
MKTSFVSQRRFIVSSAVALCVMAGAAAFAQSKETTLRIGVYDSRAIAVAYGNSAEFRKSVDAVKADYQKAKEAKDDKRVKEIETQMKAKQRRLHEQGFSTGSVATIMASIKDSLPEVAKKAGVDVIVSKWEVNYQAPGIKVVDVTDDLVALFHVSEKGLEWIKGVKTHAPVPIEQITDDMD